MEYCMYICMGDRLMIMYMWYSPEGLPWTIIVTLQHPWTWAVERWVIKLSDFVIIDQGTGFGAEPMLQSNSLSPSMFVIVIIFTPDSFLFILTLCSTLPLSLILSFFCSPFAPHAAPWFSYYSTTFHKKHSLSLGKTSQHHTLKWLTCALEICI